MDDTTAGTTTAGTAPLQPNQTGTANGRTADAPGATRRTTDPHRPAHGTPDQANTPDQTGTADEARRVDGVAQLRAVSHPTRLRIISLLGGAGPMTTGAVAEAIHETVGTVSYHLRLLKQNGLIDKVPSPDGDRRKSYWTVPQDGITVNLDRHTLPTSGAALLHATRENRDQAYDRFLHAAQDLPSEWSSARDIDFVTRLTAQEWSTMLDELAAFMDRWEAIGRRHTDGDDSRMVMTVLTSFPYEP